MSDISDAPLNPTPQTDPVPARRGRTTGAKIALAIAWLAGSLGLLLVLLAAGITWYSTTPDFERRAAAQVVSALEDATGGKVEVGHISLNLWHLSVEVDHLIIHGLEAPGEAPYLAADRIFVRVQIFGLLAHTAGASRIGLNQLLIEHPSVHLIIDDKGRTNQPVPKKKSQSNEPVIDTLLDLKAKDVELQHGIALINDRADPLQSRRQRPQRHGAVHLLV